MTHDARRMHGFDVDRLVFLESVADGVTVDDVRAVFGSFFGEISVFLCLDPMLESFINRVIVHVRWSQLRDLICDLRNEPLRIKGVVVDVLGHDDLVESQRIRFQTALLMPSVPKDQSDPVNMDALGDVSKETEAELKEQERKRKNKERSRLYRLKKRADAEAAKAATAADLVPMVSVPSPQKTKNETEFTILPKHTRESDDEPKHSQIGMEKKALSGSPSVLWRKKTPAAGSVSSVSISPRHDIGGSVSPDIVSPIRNIGGYNSADDSAYSHSSGESDSSVDLEGSLADFIVSDEELDELASFYTVTRAAKRPLPQPELKDDEEPTGEPATKRARTEPSLPKPTMKEEVENALVQHWMDKIKHDMLQLKATSLDYETPKDISNEDRLWFGRVMVPKLRSKGWRASVTVTHVYVKL
jgi:hypothetical protein